MDATNRVVAGWILEERLGSGGFGEVWRARRRHADHYRALKLVPVSSESAFVGWRHEIGRLEALSHPNIVRFYDADLVGDDGPYRDFAWIATELCERSLADELRHRDGRRLSSPECLHLVEAMLGALDAAHESGCVHRDVKPANILLHSSGIWKLCDFGTARLLPPGEAYPRTSVVGTFPYMSPAAHRGRQDQAADLYALGVTVHEALCDLRLHPRPERMTDSEYVKFILDTPPVIADDLDAGWRSLVAALIGGYGPISARDLLAEVPDVPEPPPTRRPAVDLGPAAPNGTETEIETAKAPFTRPTPTVRQPRPPTVRPPRRANRSSRAERGPERQHVLGILGLLGTSLALAGVLLYQLVPNALVVSGVVGAALLVVLLLVVAS
ncbi:MAG: serine/threonine-protein kinase [Acidimicrobiales bacterium]